MVATASIHELDRSSIEDSWRRALPIPAFTSDIEPIDP
jgi:hypothetical protein